MLYNDRIPLLAGFGEQCTSGRESKVQGHVHRPAATNTAGSDTQDILRMHDHVSLVLCKVEQCQPTAC